MTATKPMCSSALLGAALLLALRGCSYSSLPRNIRSSGSGSALPSLTAGTPPGGSGSASEGGRAGAPGSASGSGASGGRSGAYASASGGGSGAYGFASGGGSGAYGSGSGVVSMVSCTNTSCSVTLGGNGATALVFGTRISLDSIRDGRATVLVGDHFITCVRGETISTGRLTVTCTTVQPDRVSFQVSPA